MVRSTSSGQTTAINPNGRVIAMAEPFAETWLVAEVPVMTVKTIYTRFGDYLGVAFTVAAFAMLIIGAFLGTITTLKRRKNRR
jgi:apolipoprotein N-acyltransferase